MSDGNQKGRWWVWGAAAMMAGAAAYTVWNRSRQGTAPAQRLAPAFRDSQPEGESGADACQQVRNAGPEQMRDPERRPWTVVDEASDESFPASDPPSLVRPHDPDDFEPASAADRE